ncbi:MAG TPA: sugar phosphate isomerase/epimerase [Terracidiphilus sp.]|nr:sugar phosphate isomerase/epimerase [Terracidiphilus sp.]
MKIGISAFAWTADFTSQHLSLLPRIKEMGLAGVEIPMFDPAKLPVQGIRRACEQNDLECTVCAILPPNVNPIDDDVDRRRQSHRHLARCVEILAELGAKLLGGPLYAPIGYLPSHRPSIDEFNWAVEAFQSLGPLLDSNQITLSIEPVNRSETFFLRTAAEARRLCEAIGHPRIGITIDTFHANIEEKSVVDAIQSLPPHLMHLHMSENDRGLLGQGHVDFPGVVAVLRDSGYEGYLMIEGFGYSEQELHSPGYLWADLAVSPEELAREGLQYLRTILSSAS